MLRFFRPPISSWRDADNYSTLLLTSLLLLSSSSLVWLACNACSFLQNFCLNSSTFFSSCCFTDVTYEEKIRPSFSVLFFLHNRWYFVNKKNHELEELMSSILAETLAPRETGSDCCVLSRGLSDRTGLTRHKAQHWLLVQRLRKKVQSKEASEEAGTATRVGRWRLRPDTALEMVKEVVLNIKYRWT